MKIAITGHRPNKLGNDYDLKSPLITWIMQEILDIVDKHTNSLVNMPTFITGMALGIDQLFAQIATANKIPFIAAIPFKGQGLVWPRKSQVEYSEILKQASQIYIINLNRYVTYEEYLVIPFELVPKYEAFKLLDDRNHWMVDNCNKLIAVWNGTSGGTANCVAYATKVRKETIIIDPNEFKIRPELKD